VFGWFVVPPLHWRWLFWVPAGIATVVAICLAIFVKDTPEETGFHGVHAGEADHADSDVRAEVGQVFKAIARTPSVWVCALAYACTGVVRQGVDQWFPRYMQEVYAVNMKDAKFQWLAFLIPFVASAGSLLSGYLSDMMFKGRRAPVAAGLYFLEAAIIFLAAQFHTVDATILFFILIAFTANSTHSILGTAAAMDIGGRKMAGFASGLIDSFQYFGGALAGALLGGLLDKHWGYYFYFMAPFGLVGGILMLTIIGKVSPKTAP
jgi:OPA family glycerol-3-phosphate transporter-like MFS transporter